MEAERRRSARYPFVATAEIVDERENVRSTSSISDLSLQGCFVETANPFPQGTNVLLEIYTENEFLETQATVAFRETQTGMGLQFGEMQPHFAGVLNRWLAQASGGKPPRAKRNSPGR